MHTPADLLIQVPCLAARSYMRSKIDIQTTMNVILFYKVLPSAKEFLAAFDI